MVNKSRIVWDCACREQCEVAFFQRAENKDTAKWSMIIWHSGGSIYSDTYDLDLASTDKVVNLVVKNINSFYAYRPDCGWTEGGLDSW